MKNRFNTVQRKLISRILSFCFIISMVLSFFNPVMAGQGGGNWLAESAPGDPIYASSVWYSGANSDVGTTATNPYIISSARDLAGLAYMVNGGFTGQSTNYSFQGKYIKIATGSAIDLSSYAWTPIGNTEKPFKGNFDGNGVEISGLKTNSTAFGGLFGYVDSTENSMSFNNIVLKEPNINVSGNAAGLFGTIHSKNNPITIENCIINGGTVISSSDNAGGLVGEINAEAAATISSCSSSTTVSGISNVGGLIGLLWNNNSNAKMSFTNSNADGDITGTERIGGLIGKVYFQDSCTSSTGIDITSCYATGDVNANGGQAGGLIGYLDNPSSQASCNISRCYATGDVAGPTSRGSDYGGLIGQVYSNSSAACEIINSYAMGYVTGYQSSGGLVGTVSLMRTAKVNVVNTYTTGTVFAIDTNGDGFAGGIIGKYNTNSTGSSELSIKNSIGLNSLVQGANGKYNRIFGGITNDTSNGRFTGSNNVAFDQMQLGVYNSSSYSAITSADFTSYSGYDTSKSAINASASWTSMFDNTKTNNLWTYANYNLPKLGLGDANIPMPEHLLVPYSVTYDGNGKTGGTVPIDSTPYAVNATVSVSSNTGILVKTGYSFAGWNTAPDGSGTNYRAEDQINNISSNITLYAIWSKFSSSTGNSIYITSGSAVYIDQEIAIEGFTENISGAKIMIQNNKTGDKLEYTNANGISGTYSSTSGILTLAGNTTSANYQKALRSIKFSTTSDDKTSRIIDFTIGGGLYYSSTEHFYEYVSSETAIRWDDARTAAGLKTLYGRRGYLVTITSEGENNFIKDRILGVGWIGAKDISNDWSGDWRWVSGPEGLEDSGNGLAFWSGHNTGSLVSGGFANWWTEEPNNVDNSEHYANIYNDGERSGRWNDYQINNSEAKGYVVEYGGMTGDTPLDVQTSKTISIITVPEAPTNVTATAGNKQALISFTAPLDNGGSVITSYTVTSSPGSITASGIGSTITVTGLNNGTTYTFKVKAENSAGYGPDSTSSNPVTPYIQYSYEESSDDNNDTNSTNNGTVIVVVNGKEQNAGKETKTIEDGKSTVTVEVINKVIESKIEEATKNNNTGLDNIIQVPILDTKSDNVKVELTGDIVKKLEENTFDVSIKHDKIEYIIPAEEFTISKVAENLGVLEQDLQNIKVEVKIMKLDQTKLEKYNEVAKANGAELVFPPTKFEIIAKITKTNGTFDEVEINKFSNYVERLIEIPAGIDPNKITTGIVFNDDNTYSHVPTQVLQKDNKWFAVLNSLTNSNYSVVWNPVIVPSVDNHWSKDSVNDMASRLVILNKDSFIPDNAITRADFAKYIVRALGLYRVSQAYNNRFKDLDSAGDKTLPILIACEYGIVEGYPDLTFKPDKLITREEAMTMYKRAMKITKLTGKNKDRYLIYTDYDTVEDWAKSYVNEVLSAHVFNGTNATTISPKSNLTYAEAAQAIKNLLVESKLINK